jgi:peptidyl-prolyl cis-trans isomerase C
MSKHLSLIPAALALSLMLVGCNKSNAPESSANASAPAAASAPATPATVAKVNGKEIPGTLVDFLIKEQIPAGTPITDELRSKIKEHLVQREILLQAANAAGIEKKPEVVQLLDYQRGDQLVQSFLKDWTEKNKTTDADVQAYFDKKIAEIGDTEFKARHILVSTEEEATALIAKLDKKAKFADLAKASKDPGSKDKGGELDWSRPAVFAPEFAAALKTLEKGKYTAKPVKTQFGYHVILLDDSRKANNPKFEDVKAQLAQSVQQEALKKYVDDLRAKAKVE